MINAGPLSGVFAEVVRQSKRTSGLTLKITEAFRAYSVGDEVHVARYDVVPAPLEMDLWPENKLANHRTMPMADVVQRFSSSRWAEVARTSWPLERALRAFLTDPADGLNASFEEAQYPAVHELARRAIFGAA